MDGALSPFAPALCCQGSKVLRAQPRPFSVPVVAHTACRGTAGVLLRLRRGRSDRPSVVRQSEMALFFITLVLSSGFVSMQ